MKYDSLKEALEHISRTYNWLYSPKVYNTPYKRFKILLDILMRTGCGAWDIQVHHPLPSGKEYVVLCDFYYVRRYRVRQSAKQYIARQYIKRIKEGKYEERKEQKEAKAPRKRNRKSAAARPEDKTPAKGKLP